MTKGRKQLTKQKLALVKSSGEYDFCGPPAPAAALAGGKSRDGSDFERDGPTFIDEEEEEDEEETAKDLPLPEPRAYSE